MATYVVLCINTLKNKYHSILSTLTMSIVNWQEWVT